MNHKDTTDYDDILKILQVVKSENISDMAFFLANKIVYVCWH